MDPYIEATVREVNDDVDPEPSLEREVIAAVSADVRDEQNLFRTVCARCV